MENELMESKCRWIPVTERLPEDGDEVLISIDGQAYLCYYEEHSWRYIYNNNLQQRIPCHAFVIKDGSFEFTEGENFPTHWMPFHRRYRYKP